MCRLEWEIQYTYTAYRYDKPTLSSHWAQHKISCLCRFPFEQRAQLAKNDLGRRLFELMAKKQSNLAVAADVPTAEAMLKLADEVKPRLGDVSRRENRAEWSRCIRTKKYSFRFTFRVLYRMQTLVVSNEVLPNCLTYSSIQVGPSICVFKTHVDAFDKWDQDIAARLQSLADKHCKLNSLPSLKVVKVLKVVLHYNPKSYALVSCRTSKMRCATELAMLCLKLRILLLLFC